MAKYRLTNLANRDLNGIWEYTIDNLSIKQADIYYDFLIEAFNQICFDPECGKIYENVEPKLRGIKAGRHVVFYELNDEENVEISRILHESMDIRNRLKK